MRRTAAIVALAGACGPASGGGSAGSAADTSTAGETTSAASTTTTSGETTGGDASTGTGAAESSGGDDAPRSDLGNGGDLGGPRLRDCPLDAGETAMVDGMFGPNPLMGRHAWYGDVVPKQGAWTRRILVAPTVASGVAVIEGGEPEGWALLVELDGADIQTDMPIVPSSMLLLTGGLAFPLDGTVELDEVLEEASMTGTLVGDSDDVHVEGPFTALFCLAYSVYAP